MLNITLIPYVSPSYRNGYNGGDNFPTFALPRKKRSLPKGSNQLWHSPTHKTIKIKIWQIISSGIWGNNMKKLCVYLRVTYSIRREGKKNSKFTVVDTIEGVFGFLEAKKDLQEENIYMLKTRSPQTFMWCGSFLYCSCNYWYILWFIPLRW